MGEKYESLKIVLASLTKELVNLIQNRWTGEWSQQSPKVGVHFNYWDIEALPTYEKVKTELRKIQVLLDKYGNEDIDKPIGPFLEAVIFSVPNPTFVNQAIEHWWKHFVQLIETPQIPIRLFVGLSNFKAEQTEYRLDSETLIRFYQNGSLQEALSESTGIPITETFTHTHTPLHLIPGAIQIDFTMPANEGTLVYSDDTHECIKRMNLISNAIRLCSFGRIEIGPWIPITNPNFPIKGVPIINSSERRGKRFYEPMFSLDDKAWERFKSIYQGLKFIQSDNEKDIEVGAASRRRIQSAISQFTDTFNQGYWELTIVNFVIIMESLLTPDRGGGKMQLAVATSNLLGGTDLIAKSGGKDAKEVFDIVQKMYEIRNQYSHGEPFTEAEWKKNILEIAKISDPSLSSLDGGIREYTFEIMRDFARRAICAAIHLYSGTPQRLINKSLMRDLHRMHLDMDICKSILAKAKCYPMNICYPKKT